MGNNVVVFQHSLIVAICSGTDSFECIGPKHGFSDSPGISQKSNPPNSFSIDLHTDFAFIGIENPDASLQTLHVNEDVRDGILTLYVVPRHLNPKSRKNIVGKEAIFSFNKAWVPISR